VIIHHVLFNDIFFLGGMQFFHQVNGVFLIDLIDIIDLNDGNTLVFFLLGYSCSSCF